jgi:hypothetical protein
VAQKRRNKKSGWLRAALLFVFVPLFVWALAFLIWFNWTDFNHFLGFGKKTPATNPSTQLERPSKQTEKPPPEKILDEDRKKLEEILKRR